MNILIIKTGALGDVVRTSFIARALKEKYLKLNLKIFWVTNWKAKSYNLDVIFKRYIKEYNLLMGA